MPPKKTTPTPRIGALSESRLFRYCVVITSLMFIITGTILYAFPDLRTSSLTVDPQDSKDKKAKQTQSKDDDKKRAKIDKEEIDKLKERKKKKERKKIKKEVERLKENAKEINEVKKAQKKSLDEDKLNEEERLKKLKEKAKKLTKEAKEEIKNNDKEEAQEKLEELEEALATDKLADKEADEQVNDLIEDSQEQLKEAEDLDNKELKEKLDEQLTQVEQTLEENDFMNEEEKNKAFEEMLSEVDESIEEQDIDELHKTAEKLQEEIDKNFTEARAAELAKVNDQTFEEALEDTYKPQNPPPELPESVKQEAMEGKGPENAEEYMQYAEDLEKVANDMRKTALKSEEMSNQLNEMAPGNEQGEGPNNQSAQQRAQQLQKALQRKANAKQAMQKMARQASEADTPMVDMSGMMQAAHQTGIHSGGNPTNVGGRDPVLRGGYEGDMLEAAGQNTPKVNKSEAYANAIPGRKLSKFADRKGWIYIDTWYVIGPFTREREKAGKPYPPETNIDLDATYRGKKHPKTREPIKLKWRLVQSSNVRIEPPDVIGNSVYYAHTDVYSDEPVSAILSFGSDDYAKVWINDMVVIDEQGLSSWNMDQGFRKVHLKQGYNTILVRLVNGPTKTFFSLLMMPQ